jgi:hypothetical protein
LAVILFLYRNPIGLFIEKQWWWISILLAIVLVLPALIKIIFSDIRHGKFRSDIRVLDLVYVATFLVLLTWVLRNFGLVLWHLNAVALYADGVPRKDIIGLNSIARIPILLLFGVLILSYALGLLTFYTIEHETFLNIPNLKAKLKEHRFLMCLESISRGWNFFLHSIVILILTLAWPESFRLERLVQNLPVPPGYHFQGVWLWLKDMGGWLACLGSTIGEWFGFFSSDNYADDDSISMISSLGLAAKAAMFLYFLCSFGQLHI